MKIKKDNGASLTGFVITILVILLIVAVTGCVYLINNPVKEQVAVQNSASETGTNSSTKVEENNNVTNKQNTITESGIRIAFEMDFQSEVINEQHNPQNEALDLEVCGGFYGKYYFSGENKGLVCIESSYAGFEKVYPEIKIKPDSEIIDVKVATNYDGYWIPAHNAKLGDKYNYTSTAYFLFKDGTIGKITTEDIKNQTKTITKLTQYSNIVSLVSCNLPEYSGGDTNLYAIDNDGNIFELDIVAAGQ